MWLPFSGFPAHDARRLRLALALTVGFQAALAVVAAVRPFLIDEPPQDIVIFYNAGTSVLDGKLPYRDFPLEYPLLAVPFFVIPRLFASAWASYAIAFALEMLFLDLVAMVLVARLAAAKEGGEAGCRRMLWYTAFVAPLAGFAFLRFDFAPTLLAFLAALAWSRGRHVGGGVLAALGALVKVFPGAVAGIALMSEWHRRDRTRLKGLWATMATFAAGVALWFAVGGRGVFDAIRYHTERGIQLESLYAGLGMLAAKITGAPMRWTLDHMSANLVTPWDDLLKTAAAPVQLVLLAIVMWRFYRSGMSDIVRYAGAAVLAFTIGGKVLSPQFMIWQLPFVAALEGRTGAAARWLFLACCAATAAIFPYKPGFIAFQLPWVLLLNARNLGLLALLFLLIWRKAASSSRSPQSEAAMEQAIAPITK